MTADSLKKGKSLTQNGFPVAFLEKETDYGNQIFFRVNNIKSKVVVYNNKPYAPGGKDGIVYQFEFFGEITQGVDLFLCMV